MFASKRLAFIIWLPCLIALGHGCFVMVIDPSEASHSILMASLLSLVCGSLAMVRSKVIRQDKALQQLQERCEMLEQKSVAIKSSKAE